MNQKVTQSNHVGIHAKQKLSTHISFTTHIAQDRILGAPSLKSRVTFQPRPALNPVRFDSHYFINVVTAYNYSTQSMLIAFKYKKNQPQIYFVSLSTFPHTKIPNKIYML